MLRRLKSREGWWAASQGNETEALEAAGDCQSGFARPGCAVAGIKELAGQPPPQSRAEWIRAEAGAAPRAPPAFTTRAKRRALRVRRSRSCSAGGPLRSWEKDVWSSQPGFSQTHRPLRTRRSGQEGQSDGRDGRKHAAFGGRPKTPPPRMNGLAAADQRGGG